VAFRVVMSMSMRRLIVSMSMHSLNFFVTCDSQGPDRSSNFISSLRWYFGILSTHKSSHFSLTSNKGFLKFLGNIGSAEANSECLEEYTTTKVELRL
jgi:hypothetical protein